jgi:hypothetical protein
MVAEMYEDMFEARAVLLGRLGKHEGALEIYVYRLQDYIKAEEYAVLERVCTVPHRFALQILQTCLSY